MIYFTSSWDDGSEYDIKLSELLLKHNHRATFYVPIKNLEKRKVLTYTQIRELSNNFEIGAHTVNHVYLNKLSLEEGKKEIEQSKVELELILGKPIYGFCFPGGKFTNDHLEIVYQAGFSYARSNKNFVTKNRINLLDTTLQAYDHSRFTLYKNFIRNYNIGGFLKYSSAILINNRWDSLLNDIIEMNVANDSVDKITIIHLWGHSHEIEENNQWSRLENLLKFINNYPIETKTNYEITNPMLHI